MAGRYAIALFELAEEARALDPVAEDLNRIVALVRGSADLTRLVKSPAFSRAEQGRAMDAILSRLKVNPLTRKFIGLVAEKRRLFALLDMAAAYEVLLAHKRGEIKARVTTAHLLNDGQIQALKDTLRAAFHREVKLEIFVDNRLLGGLVVKVGSRMIDSSLATKLNKLKLAIREA
jgi:F-type H+-transporting ATPase subunit delta